MAGLSYLAFDNATCTGPCAAALARFPALQTLELAGTNLSDETAAPLANHKGLRQLNLQGTQLTQAGFDKLSDALPDCKIEWSPAK